MNTGNFPHGTGWHRRPAEERLEFRVLYAVSFLLCLAFVSARRIVSVFSARDGIPEGTVFAEARSAACAAVGYAFMG